MRSPLRPSRVTPLFALLPLVACSSGSSTGDPKSSATTAPVSSGTAVATTSPTGAAPPASRRPNIVFVLADDLAWNLVQYMPHVLEMQKKGTTFTRYFVTDSLCCPSRTSIFTGRYPHDTGVFTNTGKDGGYEAFLKHDNEKASFAVSLSGAGYRTAMLGKYLNGYQPAKGGIGKGWTGWNVAGNGYPEFDYELNENDKLVKYGQKPEDYLTDVVNGLGVAFLKEQTDKPVMIEIATFAPHAPYTPAPRDADKFPDLKAPRTASFDAPPEDSEPKWLKEIPPLTEKEKEQIDVHYRKRAQSVLAVDKLIGDLEEALEATGRTNDTYFVFSSDNGYHLGEHRLRAGKQTPYDTDIRVPLIVVGPRVRAGRQVDAVVENIDLCPTFEDIGGVANGPSRDGMSLMPWLTVGDDPLWRTLMLVEHHGPHDDPTDPDAPPKHSGNPTTYEALISNKSLYVEYIDGEKEFHDLVKDPDELHNTISTLADDEKARLGKALAAVKGCHDAATCWAAQAPTAGGR